MKYDELMNYIKNLTPFVPVKTEDGSPLFDLETVSDLAKRFDDPQDKLKCIHIAGTNGKGSTAEFLSGILIKSGYKTGTFTSPYLSDIREQIKVNGEMISEEAFADVFGKVIERSAMLTSGKSPSEFEMTVVAAFLYFLRCNCDICIIEAGLGGEYDATNVIKTPLLCVFTSISKDHTSVLGDSLKSIAEIKAGIIKPGCKCISTDQDKEVFDILKRRAEEKNVPLYIVEKPSEVKADISGVSFEKDFNGVKHVFKLGVPGSYQSENASIAIEAALKLRETGFESIKLDSVKAGLLETRREGRFEVLGKDPLVIADGAHNEAGVKALMRSLHEAFPEEYDKGKSFVFVSGILADKEYDVILRSVIKHIFKVYTVTPDNVRAMPAEELADIFRGMGADAEAVRDVKTALSKAIDTAKTNGIPVVVFGSLYYLGKVRSDLTEQQVFWP